jgi:hypothetical protein
VVATPRDASKQGGQDRVRHPERSAPLPAAVIRSRSTNDARFIVRDHSAYVKFSDTGKSIAPGPDAYKDSDT